MENAANPIKRALPALCFLLVMTLMVGAAELFHEREIIFPEAAAIALGALVSPKFAWNTKKSAIFFLIMGCAALGMAIVLLPLPLPAALVLAYLTGQIVLLASGTSFAPLISAAVLPVLLQTKTPVYLMAAFLLTAGILLLRVLLETLGLKAPVRFAPLPLKRADAFALLPRTLLMTALCL